MKAKIYVVTKYVVAESMADAMRKEKCMAPDAVYLDECSLKALGDELVEAAKKLSTPRSPVRKKSAGVH